MAEASAYITPPIPAVLKRRSQTLSPNGVPLGRPPGKTNNVMAEAKVFAREIIRSEDYRKSVISRAKSGELPPPIEVMLWHYAYGRPTEHVQMTVAATADLSELTTEQLAERASAVASILREAASAKAAARALESAIDAEVENSELLTAPSVSYSPQ